MQSTRSRSRRAACASRAAAMPPPTMQAQLMELLDDHKEGLGSEAYVQLADALKQMDDSHEQLYMVEWAMVDQAAPDKNGKAKLHYRRRTTVCRLLRSDRMDQAISGAEPMGVMLDKTPATWYKFLYHSQLTQAMLEKLERFSGGNLIQPQEDNKMLIVFDCSRFSPYSSLKKRKRGDPTGPDDDATDSGSDTALEVN